MGTAPTSRMASWLSLSALFFGMLIVAWALVAPGRMPRVEPIPITPVADVP